MWQTPMQANITQGLGGSPQDVNVGGRVAKHHSTDGAILHIKQMNLQKAQSKGNWQQ